MHLPSLKTIHFKKCFRQWHDHCGQCIESQGDYFEGDNTDGKVSVVAAVEQKI
jgi:hypothetical protein